MRHQLAIALCLAHIAGCGSGDSQPNVPAVTASAPPTASASATQSANPPLGDESPNAAASPFVTVGVLPSRVRLFTVGKKVLVSFEGPRDDHLQHMGVIEGDGVIEKPKLSFDGGPLHEIVAIDGDYPSFADMAVTGSNGRIAVALHFVLTPEGSWKQVSLESGYYFLGIGSVGRSLVGLRGEGLGGGFGHPKFVNFRGNGVAAVLTPYGKACNDKFGSQLPKAQVLPDAFGSTPAGDLVSIGADACDAKLVAEVWPQGESRSRVIPFGPRQRIGEGSEYRVVPGGRPEEAYFLIGQVARFDGKSVTELPALPSSSAEEAVVGKDGTLYVRTRATKKFAGNGEWVVDQPSRIYAFEAGAWKEMPGPEPDSMAVSADGTLWVSAGQLLLRTRKSPGEVSIAVSKEVLAAAAAREPTLHVPRAAGPTCSSNLVVLYGFTKTTPDDYDFPATRKALKGHKEFATTRFVVALDGGAKYFSALVPDPKTGKGLVALIEKNVQGSKPQLLCAKPEIVREIAIDLVTGALLPATK